MKNQIREYIKYQLWKYKKFDKWYKTNIIHFMDFDIKLNTILITDKILEKINEDRKINN